MDPRLIKPVPPPGCQHFFLIFSTSPTYDTPLPGPSSEFELKRQPSGPVRFHCGPFWICLTSQAPSPALLVVSNSSRRILVNVRREERGLISQKGPKGRFGCPALCYKGPPILYLLFQDEYFWSLWSLKSLLHRAVLISSRSLAMPHGYALYKTVTPRPACALLWRLK